MKIRLSIIVEKLQEAGFSIENRQKSDVLIQEAVYAGNAEEFDTENMESREWWITTHDFL